MCREGKPGGTCTLEVCVIVCVCLCVCVCVCVCLPRTTEQQSEMRSLTVREEEWLGLCPAKSFNTPANTHSHTESERC